MIGHVSGKGRTDDDIVQPIQDLFAPLRIAEPPGRDVWDRQVLTQQRWRERRKEAQHRTRFNSPRPKRVGDHDRPIARRLHETGHAQTGARVQLERIGEIGIQAPQQDFGSLQTRHGANEHTVIADGEIFAFDQDKSEIAREIGVLEIGFVHRTRRQHANARIVLSVERGKCRLESLKERCEALDMQRTVDIRHGARQRDPVLQGIAGARGRLRAIPESPPASLGRPANVDRIKPQMRATGGRRADQRPQEFRITGNHGRRQAAVAHQIGVAVEIVENGFEEFGALNDPCFELFPFRGVDQQRDVTERPRSYRAIRILIDAIEHTGISQMAIGAGKPALDLCRSQPGQHFDERQPMISKPPVTIHHLVEVVGPRLVS